MVTVEPNTKILVGARQGKVGIRYGCASCRCGTCAVRVEPVDELKPMSPQELELLQRMNLAIDGSIRLACQARIVSGQVAVDIDFQDSYSPDENGS